MQILTFDNLQWPALVDRNQPVGTISLRGHAIPCYPVLGDHQTALAGAELDTGMVGQVRSGDDERLDDAVRAFHPEPEALDGDVCHGDGPYATFLWICAGGAE